MNDNKKLRESQVNEVIVKGNLLNHLTALYPILVLGLPIVIMYTWGIWERIFPTFIWTPVFAFLLVQLLLTLMCYFQYLFKDWGLKMCFGPKRIKVYRSGVLIHAFSKKEILESSNVNRNIRLGRLYPWMNLYYLEIHLEQDQTIIITCLTLKSKDYENFGKSFRSVHEPIPFIM